jgi:hypothetical protein
MLYSHEGKKVTKAMYFSDYRSVDGIMVNHLTEWEGEGGVKGKTVIESAKYVSGTSPRRTWSAVPPFLLRAYGPGGACSS